MPDVRSTPADPADYLPHAGAGAGTGATEAGAADLERLIDYIRDSGYAFASWQVATFVTAVRTKPFVILAGISGTGKTRLPQLVAEATGAKAVVVPVRPDWTDSSDVLGYERLDGTFVPGHLLRLCHDAMQQPDKQFFFILDEMNVARVEYYFAEVLSLLENRRSDGGVVVTDPLVPKAPAEPGPPAIDWSQVYLPANVCVVGTVNMDETTHGFSRKVLDRAFVLELSDVDLNELVATAGSVPQPASWPSSQWAPKVLRLAELPNVDTDDTVKEVIQALCRANEALGKAQLQVGFRVRDEVALFCLNAADSSGAFVDADETIISPLDLCINMKVLPRIQGGGSAIREVLDDLSGWAKPGEAASEESEEPAGFPRTHKRLEIMSQRLDQASFTSYWI